MARQNSEYSPCKVYCSPSTCSGSTCPVRKRDSLPEPLHNETIYSVEQDHSRLAKRKLQPLTRAEVGPYLTSQSEGIGVSYHTREIFEYLTQADVSGLGQRTALSSVCRGQACPELLYSAGLQSIAKGQANPYW